MMTDIIDTKRLIDESLITLPEIPSGCSLCGRTGELLARICNQCRDLPASRFEEAMTWINTQEGGFS